MKSKILSLIMLVLIATLALVACGDSDEQHTHTWEDATCITAKTCTECGIETGNVSATNHNYGEWQTVKTVSCTENGIKKQTCSWCNNEKTETITATGHNYVDGVCKNCNTAEETKVRDIVYLDKGDHYEWFLGVENKNKVLTKSNVLINVVITNNSSIVYEQTFHISTSDFHEMTRSSGAIELRAKITINKSDITPGAKEIGNFSFACYGEKSSNLTAITYNVNNMPGLPQLQTTLNTPSLPKTIYNKSYSGTTNQMLKVTDITYEVSGTTMYIYFSGEKTFDSEGDNYSRIFKIGFKLYDSNGYVVDSGTIYVTALSVGDKFANTKESVYGITLGENYTIELIDVT